MELFVSICPKHILQYLVCSKFYADDTAAKHVRGDIILNYNFKNRKIICCSLTGLFFLQRLTLIQSNYNSSVVALPVWIVIVGQRSKIWQYISLV